MGTKNSIYKAEQIQRAERFAKQLAHGGTVNVKDIKDIKKLVSKKLNEIKNNCNLVIRQLKEDLEDLDDRRVTEVGRIYCVTDSEEKIYEIEHNCCPMGLLKTDMDSDELEEEIKKYCDEHEDSLDDLIKYLELSYTENTFERIIAEGIFV